MIEVLLKNGDNLQLDKFEDYSITVEAGASVTIKENDLSNSKINLYLLDDSNVKYSIINIKSSDTKRNIILNKASNLSIVEANICKTLDDTLININGEHAEVSVENLCVVDGYDQEIKTRINHNGQSSNSKINNIGVAIKNSNILFDTTGYVKNGIPGCDCRQLSKGVIIDSNSKITTRPILLIDEYDVMAYHGAAIGKMSDDELFYLMSRGLTKTEAFMLILNGLIDPIISKLPESEGVEINKKLRELLKEN